ncbi:MAG: 50S ribosomal protein L21 [Candidatus Latescibacteria bacterium]|nr:50S ribosomal protein L21 [Candidatus Latescibacterota bacterium]
MYAVVDIKGFQYKLEKGDTLRVPKFETEIGKKVKLSEVMLIADGENYSVGKPFVEGAVVEATVTSQGKYDKVIVFKKKRRKDYSVKRGHRQDFTEITIDTIKVSSAKKAAKAAEEDAEAVKSKASEKVGKAVETPEPPKTTNLVAEDDMTKSSAAPKVETAQTDVTNAEPPVTAKPAKPAGKKSKPVESVDDKTGDEDSTDK